MSIDILKTLADRWTDLDEREQHVLRRLLRRYADEISEHVFDDDDEIDDITYSVRETELRLNGETLMIISVCMATGYGVGSHEAIDSASWLSDVATEGGDASIDEIETWAAITGAEESDLYPDTPDEPDVPDECDPEAAEAVVRVRNTAHDGMLDWSILGYYATLDEAEAVVADKERGFSASCPNGYGPEWDAQPIEDEGRDTCEAYRSEMGALPDPDGPIGVLDMDGHIVERFADHDDADRWISLESTIFHRSPGRGDAYIPRSVVDLSRPYHRVGQYSTSWHNA